jgi:hypothetical protein
VLLRRRLDKIDLLEKVPLFSNLSQRHLGKISKHVDQVQVGRGRVLIFYRPNISDTLVE